MDILRIQAAVESHVAMVLENGVIYRLNHTGVSCCASQFDIVQLHLLPQEKATVVFRGQVRQFLTAGLNGKIRLPQRDDLLRGVGILHYQVAGIPREIHGLDRPLGTAADLDHFGDLNEMVLNALRAGKTGSPGLLDNLFEVAVVAVIENLRKIATGPEFPPRFIRAADKLEGRSTPTGRGWLKFIGHQGWAFHKSCERSPLAACRDKHIYVTLVRQPVKAARAFDKWRQLLFHLPPRLIREHQDKWRSLGGKQDAPVLRRNTPDKPASGNGVNPRLIV